MARALSTRVSALVDSSVSCSGCGRLTLIKTTLSAIPIYTAISIALPPWFLKALRKLMMAFLWTGMDMVQADKCLVEAVSSAPCT
jgi:hypothetical protein